MAYTDYADLQARTLKFAASADATSAAGFVNDAYREIVEMCDLNVKVDGPNTLVAGQVTYDYTQAPISIADMGKIQHIYYISSGQSYRVEPISFEKVLELRSYSAAISPPGMYYCLNGYTSLELYPSPTAGDQLTIYYNAVPTALSAGTDLPSLVPTEFRYLIPSRAAMYLADFEDPDSWISYTLEDRYQNGMQQLKKWLRDRRGEQMKRIEVGYLNRRGWIRHDNSTYYSGDR